MRNKQQGLINWIILIVIALIILGYYGIDVRKIIEKPETQENISYVTKKVIYAWENYLKAPTKYIGKDIILDKIILPLIDTVKNK